jgi:lipopolysaccharide export system permease protein
MFVIYRSILRELLTTFILALLFLNFTLMMEKLLRLSRALAGVGSSLTDFLRIVLYLQPQLLILTIPMALLLSILLTYGRMNTDNELTILRGSGMSFRAITKPVAYVGLACFLASLVMSFYLGPGGAVLLREKITQILSTRAALTIEEGIFNTSFRDIVILVKSKPSPDRLSGIFIVDDRKKEEQRVITARDGQIVQEGEGLGFLLTEGRVYTQKKDILTEIAFGRYHFALTPFSEPAQRKNSELNPFELLRSADESPDRRIPLLLEFNRRISMPAVCIIVALLGPSLSLLAGKSGRLGGLTVGLMVFVIYYTILIYGESLSRSGKVPPFVGAWTAFALLSVFSVLVFERVNKR